MKITVQLVVCEDDGHEETVTDVVILEKTCQRLEQVGSSLAEAKTLLQRLQQHLMERQAAAFLAMHTHCRASGAPLRTKGHHSLTFLSDGGDTVRDLQLYLSPEAEHLLDWFHIAMRMTVLQQTAKGLPETASDGEDTYTLRDEVVRELERLKWVLWHGNVYRALQVVQSVEMDLNAAVVNTGHDTA
jgi:hypothetical protein